MLERPNFPKTDLRRRSWQAALLVLAGGVAALVGLGYYEPPGQVGRNPGGSRLELRGVTYDPQHTWIDGNLFQRLILQVLPEAPRVLPHVGGYRRNLEGLPIGPSPPLALWIRSPRPNLYRTAWIDAHGCRISTGIESLGVKELVTESVAGRPPGTLSGKPKGLWAVRPGIVPRRGTGPLTLAVFDNRGEEATARFRIIPPPEPPDPPGWNAAALPLTVSQGDTTFTLAGLRHLEPGVESWGRSQATFRFSGKGRYSRQWQPAAIWVTDAAGNRLHTPLYAQAGRAAIFHSLCLREPAWKLRVRFARPDPAAVPPDAEWTWRDVPAPVIKQETHPRLTFRHGDVRVTLRDVIAEGFYTFRGLGGPKGLPGRMVLTMSAPHGCRLRLVRITDQDGNPVQLTEVSELWEADTTAGEWDRSNEWGGHFLYRAGSRRLNFTFALWHTRTVEYMVRP